LSDLQKRLESLTRQGLIKRGTNLEGKDPPRDTPVSRSPDTVFEYWEVGEGETKCLLFRHFQPDDFTFGRMTRVGDLLAPTESPTDVRIVRGETLAPREELLFLDIETTGLAMGTGTYAFLVGIGYFGQEGFHVDQYFMRDFTEEETLLSLLEDAIAPFQQIVTYNGRSFDLQLLSNRYLMSGMVPPFEKKTDLDLLYLSRRFFKEKLENCRLTTVERDILGFEREGDVDGSLIPALYFRYLRTGEFPEVDNVLQHNVWDVLSMAYLTHIFSSSVKDPIKSATLHKGVFLPIGTYLEDAGISDGATVERCYHEAMKSGLDSVSGYEAAKRFSLRLRRQQEFNRASEIWQDMLTSGWSGDLFPFEELAKHYEHRRKDYRKAIEYVNEAVTRLEEGNHYLSPLGQHKQRSAFLYRLSRLERRLKKETDSL
jgi:uncharacterized protein YprB with RNaseH-like and TPR domain